MDANQKAAIRARCAAATAGPWSADWIHAALRHINRNVDTDAYFGEWCEEYDAVRNDTLRTPVKDDADFIAHARADVPALLDALDAAEAECTRLQYAQQLIVTGDDGTGLPYSDLRHRLLEREVENTALKHRADAAERRAAEAEERLLRLSDAVSCCTLIHAESATMDVERENVKAKRFLQHAATAGEG